MRKKPSKNDIRKLRVTPEAFFKTEVQQINHAKSKVGLNFYVREDNAILAINARVHPEQIKKQGYNANMYVFKVSGRPIKAVSNTGKTKKVKTDFGTKIVFYQPSTFLRKEPESALIFSELEYRLFKKAKQQAILKAQRYFAQS